MSLHGAGTIPVKVGAHLDARNYSPALRCREPPTAEPALYGFFVKGEMVRGGPSPESLFEWACLADPYLIPQ
jgi:hypothetical protein